MPSCVLVVGAAGPGAAPLDRCCVIVDRVQRGCVWPRYVAVDSQCCSIEDRSVISGCFCGRRRIFFLYCRGHGNGLDTGNTVCRFTKSSGYADRFVVRACMYDGISRRESSGCLECVHCLFAQEDDPLFTPRRRGNRHVAPDRANRHSAARVDRRAVRAWWRAVEFIRRTRAVTSTDAGTKAENVQRWKRTKETRPRESNQIHALAKRTR